MARGDISIVRGRMIPIEWKAEANATAMYAGEPVKLKAAGSPYAIPLEDGDLTVGTDTVFLGICASDSTQTASADGVVRVYMPLPELVYECKAKTSSTVDTAAEIAALVGDRKVLDLTSSSYTMDAAEADNAANAFYIIGGDHKRFTLQFTCRLGAAFTSL